MSDLTDAERAILLTPCACGHDLNSHGSFVPCWTCEDDGTDCVSDFEALLCERVATIVSQRADETAEPKSEEDA